MQQHQQHPSDEDDQRRNRFLDVTSPDRDRDRDRDREQRAVSQPPHSNSSHNHAQNLISPSPSSSQQQQQQQQQQPQHIPTSSPWSTQQRTSTGLNTRAMPMPMSQSIPTHTPHARSSSFSVQTPSHFSSAMRDARTFSTTFETFEDEEGEEEGFVEDTDTYDERYFPPQPFRGRPYGSDLTRSRSHSLATTSRPGPIGSPLQSSALWESPASASGSGPLNIPSGGGRYGDIKPPLGNGGSRYGSLGTSLHQPSCNGYSAAAGTTGSSALSGSGGGGGGTNDISNMSPFVRDVGQILLDDGSAFRELWAGMNPPRDEVGGGGGSGTTSRRHSVSVVQPRRGPQIVGFNVPGQGQQGQGQGGGEEATITTRPSVFHTQSFGRGGLMLSDDDLASDLGMLSLNPKDGPGPVSSSSSTGYGHPPSQPASLPIYAPHSRSPVSASSDRLSPYQSINLTIPSSVGGGSSFPSSSRHHQQQPPIGSPSESGLSAGSPARSSTHSQFDPDAPYPGSGGGGGQQQQPQGQGQLTARFIPGQGIQYLPQTTTTATNGMGYTSGSSNRATGASSSSGFTGLASSPTATRTIQPQQPPYYPHHQHHQQPINRRSSLDATSAPLTELGKGVPLHSVPASWPLYIVEFKAGRTDLFYLTDLSLDIRVGDLVIVEADRGKDLGKVVNDSITLKEVEEFQREQMARVGYGDGQPTSPGGAGSSASGSGAAAAKKEINPKMIYGKAHGQDTQLLLAKIQDEVKALQLCQSKVRQKKLPMEVIDAEYQWDRRKLTFYFVAEKRIDFRELVRELFRLYKTRIWMASLQGPTYDQ